MSDTASDKNNGAEMPTVPLATLAALDIKYLVGHAADMLRKYAAQSTPESRSTEQKNALCDASLLETVQEDIDVAWTMYLVMLTHHNPAKGMEARAMRAAMLSLGRELQDARGNLEACELKLAALYRARAAEAVARIRREQETTAQIAALEAALAKAEANSHQWLP